MPPACRWCLHPVTPLADRRPATSGRCAAISAASLIALCPAPWVATATPAGLLISLPVNSLVRSKHVTAAGYPGRKRILSGPAGTHLPEAGGGGWPRVVHP